MSILVAYASKHGSTQEIAERIAEKLNQMGQSATVQEVRHAKDLSHYDAYVIGSAVYFGSWMKEATSFVRANRELLASRPVWLFSSGPLGTEKVDGEGQDLGEAAEPKELTELTEAIKPRGHLVFFGKLDPDKFGLMERLLSALPGGKKLLLEGDFRDWDEIDAWAAGIAREMTETRRSSHGPRDATAEGEARPG